MSGFATAGSRDLGDDKTGFVIEPLHRGFVFNAHMQINLVEDGMSRRPPTIRQFRVRLGSAAGQCRRHRFSGFRVLAQQGGRLSEIAIFQGADFFRARAPGQTFGVQARGLSLKNRRSARRGIPLFKAVWIEKPSLAANALVIHALLDPKASPGRTASRCGRARRSSSTRK